MINMQFIINRLLVKFPVFKVFIDGLGFIEDKNQKTAATDGRNVYYNTDFFKRIPEDKQDTVTAHELLHVSLKHLDRMKGRNIEVWNYATDAVINQMLKKYGFQLLDGMIDCPDAASMSAEEYYEKMINNPNLESILEKYRAKKQQKDSVISTHEHWGKETLDRDIPNFDEKTFKSVNDSLIEAENREFLAKINSKQEVVQLGQIKERKPVLDWKTFLKKHSKKVISADYNFFKGEFDENGIYYYPYELEKGCEVEILLDTSGSVDDNLVRNFLKECKSILEGAKLKIACFDDKFYGFEEIKHSSDIDNFEIKGRGGTNFEVAVSAFTSKSKIKIIFTDGYAEMPQKNVDAIWIVYSAKKIKPPGGTVININKDEIINHKKSRSR